MWICTPLPPGRAQLKPLHYKTHPEFPGLGIIKIHYFSPHSPTKSVLKRWYGACRCVSTVLSLDLLKQLIPGFSFSASQSGPWSQPFLSAVDLQKEIPLNCSLLGRRHEGKMYSLPKQNLLFPILLQEKTPRPLGKNVALAVPSAALLSCCREKCYRKVGYFIYISS